ncbi:ERMES complex Ca(2+)-binding regulatory GTPase gem1 [Scheffersomyces spartinae]|uniref:Mitochondrial Rho GTPase n=1 Tax=Scheffersomyces spartinae TaxID=45513 RepID=A0A9P7V5U1_9ASCO|nr:ERMES complex Ca(2+)-binding regulatory GTPase gem1 [Scheffersomyces spartinae]KAG7191699.1 ERMES complex Ca(2+)-binding regulatory GTPase gem1 [Scheffersomyces spartinae]
MPQESLRIVVCGDESVGKSSIINYFIRESFPNQIQKVLPPITISINDYYSSIEEYTSESEKVATALRRRKKSKSTFERGQEKILKYLPVTTIIDTACTDLPELQKELKRANVIWLIYTDHYTYERVSLYWLPMFRSLGINLPVIVCSNKCDLIVPKLKWEAMDHEEFTPLINEFKEIESCVRCSAKTGYNIVEAFYLCQRSITHPISPIFDAKEGNLKPLAVKAFRRIFTLSDTDQDGYLDFKEFAELHRKCFGKEFSEVDFQRVLRTLSRTLLPMNEKERETVSEDGFVLLNKIYCQRGRHETAWGILRSFNYTNTLTLEDDFLHPEIDVNPLSSVELSPVGFKFFVDLFIKFDKDNDGGLSNKELANLFAPTPGVPKLWTELQFPSSVVCNESGYVTLQGWLAQWCLSTFLDYKVTLEYLAYLGFDNGSSIKALKITKPHRKRQRQGKVYRLAVNDRNVFSCFILGASNSGKSSLLDLFVNGTFIESYTSTTNPRMCAKDIELRGGKQCYLILEELGHKVEENLTPQRLEHCDVVCYAYDSSDPDSFQYLVDLRSRHSETLDQIPAVFVALKADLDKQQQRSDVQPENYTRDLFLNSPLHISSTWTSSLHELFSQLVDAAKNPITATPGLDVDVNYEQQETMKRYLMVGSAISVMSLVSLWIWKSSLQSSNS